MKKIVGAFVGFKADFEHPFQVDTDHGNALSRLVYDREEFGIIFPDLPKEYGFVVKHDDGHYSVVNRNEAYVIARIANQIRKGDLPMLEKCESLNSYNIDWVNSVSPNDLFTVQDLAHATNKKYKSKKVDL